jgi:cobalt/nickel transport system permease protein
MHIAEGILSFPALAGGYILTVGGLSISLKSLRDEKIVLVAVLSSAFFVASLIHIPLGPTSVHLILIGLLGILLGWQTFCAFFVALLLQAILFQFGGLTTLGINTVNMAFPALICYYLFHRIIAKASQLLLLISGFLCGFLGVFLGAVFVSLSLLLGGEHFFNTAKLVVVAHIPVMIIEGIITALTLAFLKKVKPQMLEVAYG